MHLVSGDSQHDPWWQARDAAQRVHPACSFVSPVLYVVLHFFFVMWLVFEVYRYTQLYILKLSVPATRVFQILHTMCVPIYILTFLAMIIVYILDILRAVAFSPHPAPQLKLKMLNGLHRGPTNALINYFY